MGESLVDALNIPPILPSCRTLTGAESVGNASIRASMVLLDAPDADPRIFWMIILNMITLRGRPTPLHEPTDEGTEHSRLEVGDLPGQGILGKLGKAMTCRIVVHHLSGGHSAAYIHSAHQFWLHSLSRSFDLRDHHGHFRSIDGELYGTGQCR